MPTANLATSPATRTRPGTDQFFTPAMIRQILDHFDYGDSPGFRLLGMFWKFVAPPGHGFEARLRQERWSAALEAACIERSRDPAPRRADARGETPGIAAPATFARAKGAREGRGVRVSSG